MYNRDKIIQTLKEITKHSEDIEPYVIIAQPKRNEDDIPAQFFRNGDICHIDLMGFSYGYVDVHGHVVDVARNYLFERALASESKYLLFIGDDTVFPYDGFKKLHEVAEKNPNSIITGVYYVKAGSPMVFIRDGVYIKTTNCDPGQVFEAWQTGMDCMLIPMHIIRTLYAQDPDLPFCVVANGIKDEEGNEIPFVGEDNFFAHRVRKAGFNFLTTTDVQCLHVDMDTGKYSAHPTVNLDHYYCNVKITEPLTLADKARLERRWHERLPKKMENVPSAIGLGNLLNEESEMIGLEVGTQDGDSTEFLLNKFPKLKLFGVDPYDSYRDWDGVQILKQYRQKTFEKFLIKMHKYGNRYTHIPATSDQAVDEFKNDSLDFIFIDGDHSYEQVLKDLRNFYCKVKTGGIFSGHDYKVLPEVKKAVDEFAAEIGKEVLHAEVDVWYWVK